jgi:hypothetical protein
VDTTGSYSPRQCAEGGVGVVGETLGVVSGDWGVGTGD